MRMKLLVVSIAKKGDVSKRKQFIITGTRESLFDKQFISLANIIEDMFDLVDLDKRTIRIDVETEFSNSTVEELEGYLIEG